MDVTMPISRKTFLPSYSVWQPPRRRRGGWPFFPPLRLPAFTPFLLLFLPFAFCLLIPGGSHRSRRAGRGGWPFFPPLRLPAFTPFLLLFLPFAFCLLPCSYADYADGNGSPEFPYEIAESNQLIYMSEHPEHWSKHFILTADINLALADPNIFTTAVIAPDTSGANGFQGTTFTGTWDIGALTPGGLVA